MKKFGFSKTMRLLKPADFDRVFRLKCSSSDGLLVVYVAPNETNTLRLGLVVSRKVGGAVQRNRWKRLLREAFRLEQHTLTVPCDLVLLPKAKEVPTLDALRKSLPALVRRAGTRLQQRMATAEDGA